MLAAFMERQKQKSLPQPETPKVISANDAEEMMRRIASRGSRPPETTHDSQNDNNTDRVTSNGRITSGRELTSSPESLCQSAITSVLGNVESESIRSVSPSSLSVKSRDSKSPLPFSSDTLRSSTPLTPIIENPNQFSQEDDHEHMKVPEIRLTQSSPRNDLSLSLSDSDINEFNSKSMKESKNKSPRDVMSTVDETNVTIQTNKSVSTGALKGPLQRMLSIENQKLSAISEENLNEIGLTNENEDEQASSYYSNMDLNSGDTLSGGQQVADSLETNSSDKHSRPSSAISKSSGAANSIRFDDGALGSDGDVGSDGVLQDSDGEVWDSDFSFSTNDMSLGRASNFSDFDNDSTDNPKYYGSGSSSCGETVLQVKIRRKPWSRYRKEARSHKEQSNRVGMELRRKFSQNDALTIQRNAILEERKIRRKRAQSAIELTKKKTDSTNNTPRQVQSQRSKSSIGVCMLCAMEGTANHSSHGGTPVQTPRSSRDDSSTKRKNRQRSRKSSSEISRKASHQSDVTGDVSGDGQGDDNTPSIISTLF